MSEYNEQELQEAKKIADYLRENEIAIKEISGIFFIKMLNEDYRPDDGSNPFIACTLDCLATQFDK